MEYQHDRHSVHLIVYHLIFCPKYRHGILVGPVHKRLEQIIHEVINEQSWHMIELAPRFEKDGAFWAVFSKY